MSTATAVRNDARLVELDFARGVAILLAVGWHFHVETGILWVDALQAPGTVIGWAGVDLFFVLSGFLIGGIIFDEVMRTGGFDARRFLIRRAFKIWPVLYAYIALLLVTGRYAPMDIVPQTLFHVQNYWQTPLSHLWSLAVEEHFYLSFALLGTFFSIARMRSSQIPFLLVGIMALALAARLAGAASGIDGESLQIQTHFRIDSLACGVLLAYLKSFKPQFFSSLLRRKPQWAAIVALGVTFLVLADRLTPTIGYSVAYVAGAAFLLLLIESRFMLARSWFVRGMAWIGLYSYAMYVFQFVLYRALEKVWDKLGLGTIPPPVELLMKYGGAIAAAVIVTKMIEKPGLKLRNRLFPSDAHMPAGVVELRPSPVRVSRDS